MTVTFFGHSNTESSVQIILEKILTELIEIKGATNFYVGNHGNFDTMVLQTLKSLKNTYPHIRFSVVLAYIPQKQNEYSDFSYTIYPDGLEHTPLRFAICKRNEWMINKSDIVITYVDHNFGGAAKYKCLAEKRGKTVINLAQPQKA